MLWLYLHGGVCPAFDVSRSMKTVVHALLGLRCWGEVKVPAGIWKRLMLYAFYRLFIVSASEEKPWFETTNCGCTERYVLENVLLALDAVTPWIQVAPITRLEEVTAPSKESLICYLAVSSRGDGKWIFEIFGQSWACCDPVVPVLILSSL